LDGKPLEDGEIFFRNDVEGASDSMPIKGGKYEGKVRAGKRRVEIIATREFRPPDMPDAPPQRVNYLPSRYNTESKLEAEVKESGPNVFDYQVTSK
jgi:hypothetical protein